MANLLLPLTAVFIIGSTIAWTLALPHAFQTL
jgi:hypothetical protein